MKIIKGDLIQLALAHKFDVIVHGCNCFHTMGAGIAKQLKQTFPDVYLVDKKHTRYADESKLGTFSSASFLSEDNHVLTILNAYTQFNYSGSGVKVNYSAISSIFSGIKELYSGKKIAYPKIGAGLAGGDWSIISSIIDEKLEGEDHTLVVYSRSR